MPRDGRKIKKIKKMRDKELISRETQPKCKDEDTPTLVIHYYLTYKKSLFRN